MTGESKRSDRVGYPRLAMLALPYVRAELPGWGRVCRAARISQFKNDPLWVGAPTRTLRGKLDSYFIDLDLRKATERISYFLGRYVSLDVLLSLKAVLSSGTCFLDVGANIGMLTLYAASLVGKDGSVHAFEPNPSAFRRLSRSVERNDLKQVVLYPQGLSDTDGTTTLKVINNSSETGTLASSLPQRMADAVTTEMEVEVHRGDDMIGSRLSAGQRLVVKIDVEGFEVHVLRGMENVITQYKPVIMNEVYSAKLQASGSCVSELFHFLSGHGYLAFEPQVRRNLWRHELRLRPVAGPDKLPDQCDLFWLHRDSQGWAGIEGMVVH